MFKHQLFLFVCLFFYANSLLGEGERKVIGSDERIRIEDMTRLPYRAIGRVATGCTGTLIGPKHVITAAHCVYSIAQDRYYGDLEFAPRQNGKSHPDGTINAVKAYVPKEWSRDHNSYYDYAVIELSERIGDKLGWIEIQAEEAFNNSKIEIAGYPSDKSAGTMWSANCQAKVGGEGLRFYYDCDTFNGMSGSTVRRSLSNGKEVVFGIHSGGSTQTNAGTKITQRVYDEIRGWMGQ